MHDVRNWFAISFALQERTLSALGRILPLLPPNFPFASVLCHQVASSHVPQALCRDFNLNFSGSVFSLIPSSYFSGAFSAL